MRAVLIGGIGLLVGGVLGWMLHPNPAPPSAASARSAAPVVAPRPSPSSPSPPPSLPGNDCSGLRAENLRLTEALALATRPPTPEEKVTELLGELETGIPFDDRLPERYHPEAAQELVAELQAWLDAQEFEVAEVRMDCTAAPCLFVSRTATIHRADGGTHEDREVSRAIDHWAREHGVGRLTNHGYIGEDASHSMGMFLPPEFEQSQPDLAKLFEASFEVRSEALRAPPTPAR